jgi:hypothetical protein
MNDPRESRHFFRSASGIDPGGKGGRDLFWTTTGPWTVSGQARLPALPGGGGALGRLPAYVGRFAGGQRGMGAEVSDFCHRPDPEIMGMQRDERCRLSATPGFRTRVDMAKA